MELVELRSDAERLEGALRSVVVGQGRVLRCLTIALYSGGHVLLEGVPGVGKTLMAKALSRAISAAFARVQFTPDMMPADLVGTEVYDAKTATFRLKRGPLFSTIILADEINRTPPKTQSALLQVMEERSITIGEHHETLSGLFTVLATQNPVELEGTYPLPEAQVDRFMMKILVDYPTAEEDLQVLQAYSTGQDRHQKVASDLQPALTEERVLEGRKVIKEKVHTSNEILEYIAKIVRKTRSHPQVYLGASPRAAINLLMASQANAALAGRDFTTPDDVQFLTGPALRHRLLLSPEAQVDGLTVDEVVGSVVAAIEVPR